MSADESDGSYNEHEQSDEDDDSSFEEERVAKAKAKPSSAARKSSPSKNRPSLNVLLTNAAASNQRSSPTNRKIAPTSKRTAGEAKSRKRKGSAAAAASTEIVGNGGSDSEGSVGPTTGRGLQKVQTGTKKLLGKRNSTTRKESMLDANDSDFGGDNETANGVVKAHSPKVVTTTKPTKRLLSKKAVVLRDTYDIVLPPHIVNSHPQHGECTILMQIDHCHSMDLAGAVGAIGRLEADQDRGTFLAR
jgi:hypothetical protein